ncbi:ankyrin repeat-containing domain protein [Trichoderma sp. SZMC 28013]
MALNGESSKQGHTYGPTTVHDSHIHQGDNIYLSNETPKIDCRDALLLKDPFAYRESLKSDKGERASGTCEWIRENEIYRSWVDGDEHCLWICGGPGKGKTMLSIFLTEELERKQPKGEHDHDTTLLYFFCTNGNESYNNATVVLRGLAYQLLSKHPDISTSVSQYFETPKHTANTLASPEILWMVFKTLLRASKLDTVYCILDGLDECDGKSIGILVKQFRDFYSPSDHTGPIAQNLKLAIVSRKINGLEDFPQIRLDPDNNNCINEDIKRFISTAMQELSRRQHHDDDFLRDVENTLLRRSDGTFLWIGFVMKELLEMSTRMEVEEVLHALPQGLPAMYGRMLRQIKSSQRHIISTILRCVTVARRPMTLEELKTAVALLCNAPIDSTPIMRDRIASCGPILQTSEGQDTCSLVHQSARDYLLREEVDNDPILEGFRIKEKEVHTSLARICLAYIKNSDFRHGYLDITDASVLQKSPLLGYATQHWLEHARYAEEEVDISKTFFQKDHGVWKRWYEAYKVDHKLILNPATGDSTLHIASYLGIVPLVRKLLQANAWRISPKFQKYVNWRNRVGRTPLILAAGQGHHDVVQLLLANGADVYLRSDGRSLFSGALVDAATWGHTSVIQLLLANGTDPKLRCYKLALNYAADSGHTAIVQLLLAKHEGINVDSFRTHRLRGVDSAFQTALSLAAGNGHEAIVRLLLANGADVNIKDEHGNTALQKAARGGHEAIATVRLLLVNGADVNIQDQHGNTALYKATKWGSEAIVRLLLENGADSKDDAFDKALAEAAWRGHEAIVRLMLADSAHADIKGSAALIRAAGRGNKHILRMLLENGADVNEEHLEYGIRYTALEMAAKRGHISTVQFLLTNGAWNVSTKDTEEPSKTALDWAVQEGHGGIVQLLLANGVSRADLIKALSLSLISPTVSVL